MAIPAVLKDFIRKHIINHFHRYVQHLDDENIEKTSNKVENYYRQTNPEKIKKLYKTKNGILTFLNYPIHDSFKNFVDFQNPFCDCHSKLDLCDIFVLKRLVWS